MQEVISERTASPDKTALFVRLAVVGNPLSVGVWCVEQTLVCFCVASVASKGRNDFLMAAQSPFDFEEGQ